MTIQTENGKITYIADGVTVSYAVPFYFFNKQLAVYLDDAETPLEEGFDISGGGSLSGGEVTFAAAPSAETRITIARNVELTQLISFMEGEDFPASDFEYALDKIVMALQQLKDGLKNALVLAPGSEVGRDEMMEFINEMKNNFTLIKELPALASDVLEIYNQWQNSVTGTVAEDDGRMVTSGGVWEYVNDTKAKKYTDITVSASSVVADSTYEAYPYCADITLSGVDAGRLPLVVFALEDAVSGNFAPLAEASAGKVTIYMKKQPETDISIPAVIVQ